MCVGLQSCCGDTSSPGYNSLFMLHWDSFSENKAHWNVTLKFWLHVLVWALRPIKAHWASLCKSYVPGPPQKSSTFHYKDLLRLTSSQSTLNSLYVSAVYSFLTAVVNPSDKAEEGFPGENRVPGCSRGKGPDTELQPRCIILGIVCVF